MSGHSPGYEARLVGPGWKGTGTPHGHNLGCKGSTKNRPFSWRRFPFALPRARIPPRATVAWATRGGAGSQPADKGPVGRLAVRPHAGVLLTLLQPLTTAPSCPFPCLSPSPRLSPSLPVPCHALPSPRLSPFAPSPSPQPLRAPSSLVSPRLSPFAPLSSLVGLATVGAEGLPRPPTCPKRRRGSGRSASMLFPP